MALKLEDLRHCFEGAVPAVIATSAPDGTPNVAYLSQVHYVDDAHVALTFQFFNTTRRNILVNPRAVVQVVDPVSAAHFRLRLEYLRTETDGPLFENMKAKLAGIASHSGMSKVFRLLGSDIYRVLEIECVFGESSGGAVPRRNLLPGLRACLSMLAGCTDLAALFDVALLGLERHCDIRHGMLLMHDAGRARLYTVASRGYPESGVGSEIRIGEGIIGVAARERTPIRIGFAAQEYLYSRAVREGFEHSGSGDALEFAIPFPGLANSGSQLAVPLLLGDRLLGLLFLESVQEMRFTYEDEDALVILAGQLALMIERLTLDTEPSDDGARPAQPLAASQGKTVTVKHFAADRSVFLDNDYLIKGVAGAILWKLLRDYRDAGRSEFSNRELRLDSALGLPEFSDNLEARLILLQRRLAERCDWLAIEKTGRGRFRLRVGRPLRLIDRPGA